MASPWGPVYLEPGPPSCLFDLPTLPTLPGPFTTHLMNLSQCSAFLCVHPENEQIYPTVLLAPLSSPWGLFLWPIGPHCILGTLKYTSCSVSPPKTFRDFRKSQPSSTLHCKWLALKLPCLQALPQLKAMARLSLSSNTWGNRSHRQGACAVSGGQTDAEAVTEEGGIGNTMKHRACLQPSRWALSAGPQAGAC